MAIHAQKKGRSSADSAADKAKLDQWSQDRIEAQYYAIQGRHSKSGRYEDEIFHKIEALHLDGLRFHALDPSGREVATWLDDDLDEHA